MKKKVAIIGSGVAGLVLANLLRTNSNFEFVVYEKENVLNLEEGYGIQLSVNSVSILNKIGFNQLSRSEKYFPSKFFKVRFFLSASRIYLFNYDPIYPYNIIILLFFFDFFIIKH